MSDIVYTQSVDKAITAAATLTVEMNHEFITPEHILKAMLGQEEFISAVDSLLGDIDIMNREIDKYLAELETVPENHVPPQCYSMQAGEMFGRAMEYSKSKGHIYLAMSHLVVALGQLKDSMAAYVLKSQLGQCWDDFVHTVMIEYNEIRDDESDDDFFESLSNNPDLEDSVGWKGEVICINDYVDDHNPLIGREKELDRTIQILCRKEKNNPLHIGFPGVGKTALVYGLARMINEGKVPEKLKDAKIYSLEIGSLVAGTQYRGELEKKLKRIMDGLLRETNPILYIDEIHNPVGAGQTGEGSLDASNMLKPYLETGRIRFIGSTTYDEYKRYFERSKGLVRRFSQVDIPETTETETIEIIKELQPGYESFHAVTYQPDAIEFAVKGSARFINDRYLPDKAIDLIDEAGAYRHTHPSEGGKNVVDKELVSEILSKISKVENLSLKEEGYAALENLENEIKGEIYGQDEAVKGVAESVLMSKAGLTEPTKPIATLLFVGPTGVGKTEVAKVLAEKMGIGFVRFDMSEYAEKHAVAKLIGSPAGYVGYEDGGLLTDAIRKTPDCVLLFDEIEKAHPDIYNILLQVMDYASLKDNKGNVADFRNVIIIMTSNSGAQYAKQANVGFASSVTAGEYMLKQVKKTFKPEFINRLSDIVVFHDMDRTMAGLILDKKLKSLSLRLDEKKVTLYLSESAREYLLEKGFSKEYGGREIDRVLSSRLNPLLMREILFGKLKQGGVANIVYNKDKDSLTIE